MFHQHHYFNTSKAFVILQDNCLFVKPSTRHQVWLENISLLFQIADVNYLLTVIVLILESFDQDLQNNFVHVRYSDGLKVYFCYITICAFIF